jgi:hypothetical protein
VGYKRIPDKSTPHHFQNSGNTGEQHPDANVMLGHYANHKKDIQETEYNDSHPVKHGVTAM